MTEYADGHERTQSRSYQNADDGIHLCSYCHLQLGEGSVRCVNCALAEFEDEHAQLKVKLKSAEFWSNWVYPEGATAEDVQNELADFKDLIDRFSKVLDHATGGRMSKANYTVEAMCSEIDDYYGQT